MDVQSRQFVAHYRQSDQQPQLLRDHLLQVKRLAELYSGNLNVTHIAGLAGLLHDLGKYTDAFQNYLWLAVFHPERAPKRGSVDHASAGGKLLYNLFHNAPNRDVYKLLLAEIVGNAIISHHSYLTDFLDPNLTSPYLKRVTKDEEKLPEYDQSVALFYKETMPHEAFIKYANRAVQELQQYIKTSKGNIIEKLTLLLRFVYSCLIDADRTNTRQFEENNMSEEAVHPLTLFHQYYQRLIRHLTHLNEQPSAKTTINRLRNEMSTQCDHFAENSPGVYTLSIPTGGGKTLASLRYALKHAQLYHKKRVIYVIPYTTIIEQNAEVIRSVLKDNQHILEHHSNVVNEQYTENEMEEATEKYKLDLARDNWDCPVILTTMVQFLNTFYKRGSRNIRRLHRLTQSVIVFDEVQKVPIHCVTLFNQALNFLSHFGQTTILLCTATQPALDFVHHRLETNSNGEIVGHLQDVAEAFKRVNIVDYSRHAMNNQQLVDFLLERLQKINSILVILNTKSVVRKLYQVLNSQQYQDIYVYHLSTSMCAVHREKILEKVKQQLNEIKRHPEKKIKIICISTQLIEAGVDISFECVVRSLAGLDSIAQAAGRCNRNGEYRRLCNVYLINHAEEKLGSPALRTIREGKLITENILADLHRDPTNYEGNILSKTAMDWYFKNYFTAMRDELNLKVPRLHKTIVNLLYDDPNNGYGKAYQNEHHHRLPLCLSSSLRTAADFFYVIKDETLSVIVPYGKGKDIIAQLGSSNSIDDLGKLLRQAQRYSVNLYQQEADQLDREKQLSFYFEKQIVVLNEASYSDEFGVDIKGEGNYEGYMY
jgi:CRISPR-associated endonuclease/helicase Cas3